MNSQQHSLILALIAAVAAFQLIALITTFVQVLRVQLHAMRLRRLEALPDLAPDQAAALAEVEALGFVRLSQSNVEYGTGSFLVALLRHTGARAYAELSFMPGGSAGYPISFYSFGAEGRLLATSNRASWMIFASPDGVERADPYAETLEAHWKAHQARITEIELATIDDAEAERRIGKLTEGYLPLLQESKLCILDRGAWHPSVRAAAQAAWTRYKNKNKLAKRYLSPVTDGPYQSQFYARGYLATENTRANRPSRQNVKASLLVLTVLASLLLWGLQFNWMMGLVLVIVLLVHEGGHALAMRAFSYRDVTMFFVPFVGAMVTGTPKNIPAWKQAIVLFAGPLPGLIVGTLVLVFGALQLGGLPSDWRMAASVAIGVNLFNLLPLTPLDGGRLVELSLFARWPRTRLVFSALSLLALAAFGLRHRTMFFSFVVAFFVTTLVNQARVAKLQRAWRPGLSREDQVRNLFEVARQAFRVQTFARQYALVRAVFVQKAIRPSRWWEATVTLTLLLSIWSASGYTAYLASSRHKVARREGAVNIVARKGAMAFDPPLNGTLERGDKAVANKEFDTALKAYQDAARDPSPRIEASALNRLGELHQRGLGVRRDDAEAFQLFRKAAVLKNAYAEANVGNCLLFGLGTARNLEQAALWAEKGAKGGVVMAMNQMGWQDLDGLGVRQDLAAAKVWYEKSASEADAIGELQLGWIYVHVAPVNYEQGLIWYKKAADQGDETALSNIGYLYQNGLGVEKDFREAARWYEKAVNAGSSRGQFHLGQLYDAGLGVPINKGLARALMEKAAANDDPDAAHWLSIHKAMQS